MRSGFRSPWLPAPHGVLPQSWSSGAFPGPGSVGGLTPQPWGGEVGRIRAGLCPRGEPGVPATAGACPLRRHLCLSGCGLRVGHQGICRRSSMLRWRCLAQRPHAWPSPLRPRGRIRWLEASSGPERLFRHVGRLAVTPFCLAFSGRRVPADQGPGEGTLGWLS